MHWNSGSLKCISRIYRANVAGADQGRFLQSQTLERIPAGHVLNKAVSMESLMAGAGRRAGPNTRQSGKKKTSEIVKRDGIEVFAQH